MGGTHNSEPEPYPALRVRALESLLIEKGLLSSDVVDKLVAIYENDVGPMNGARVVARAWVDSAYKQRLLADGAAAIAELGFGGRGGGDKLVAVENTPTVHNLVVCTLCSCYPWPVLGLPPVSSSPSRSRFGSGTAAPRSATWCCPNAPPAPGTSARPSWRGSSPVTR